MIGDWSDLSALCGIDTLRARVWGRLDQGKRVIVRKENSLERTRSECQANWRPQQTNAMRRDYHICQLAPALESHRRRPRGS